MEKRLGAGGMATVFLARDERLERPVAIKRLHADSPEEVGRRFQREAKVGASLNHPNIVGVYDTVTDDEDVLIVMEFVDGHTLRDEIATGPMAPARAIEVLAAVASALDHAHENGVVHRDVKPANVLIAEQGGAVKLADLGIASAAEQTSITRSGTVLGTASYMAPERLDGGAGGPEVDIYALAAVAFEMLSGHKAVEGATPVEIARRVATEPPRDLRDIAPRTPQRAAEALKRGLAKNPQDRPATAGALVRELSSAYADDASERSTKAIVAPPPPVDRGGDSAVPPPPPPSISRARSGRPAWLVPAALLALVAIAVLLLVLGSGGSDSKRDTAANTPTTHSKPKQQKKAAPKQQQPQQSTPATPPPAPAGAGSPTEAVSSFYSAAASHQYDKAWALGTDNLHSQLGGRQAFEQQQSSLQQISFPKLEVTSQSGDSATVSFQSIAQHTDHTDQCTGQIALVNSGGGWLLDQLQNVACHPAGGGAAKPKKPEKPGKGKGGKKD